jgi:hypothetical protein
VVAELPNTSSITSLSQATRYCSGWALSVPAGGLVICMRYSSILDGGPLACILVKPLIKEDTTHRNI